MAQRIFVTGASGRIGLPLVQALSGAGHHVIGLARGAAKAGKVRTAGAADCLVGDINDPEVLCKGCVSADMVLHLAGGMRGPGRQTPELINRQGTMTLVRALEQVGQAPKRVLFTSSCAVYGDRSGLWIDESHAISPQTDYGRSKAQAEQILQDAATRQGFELVIARLAAVYGPGFPLLLEGSIRKRRAWLPGEGSNRMPLIHVDDCVAALELLASEAAPGIYHVAGCDQPTLREFYTEVARLTGGSPPRFWSTYIPSYVQVFIARQNERLWSHFPVTPRFTPDMLRIFRASARLKLDRLEKEFSFAWKYPDFRDGLKASLSGHRPDGTVIAGE